MKQHFIGLCILVFIMNTPLSATICFWIGGDGNWNEATNWSCGVVPGIGDRVTIFTNNDSITVDINVTIDTLFFDGSSTRLIGDSSITVQKYMTWQFGIIEVDITTEDLLIEDNTSQSKFLCDTLSINGDCEYNFTQWLWIQAGGVLINNGNLQSDGVFQINSQGSPRGSFINHGTVIRGGIGAGGSASWLPIENYGTMKFLVGNFFRGDDFINYGTLHIDESMTGSNSSELQNHGVLSGNGLIELPTNYDLDNGIIAPGDSPGQLSFRNDGSVVNLDGEIQIEIDNDSGPGLGHDHINVTAANVVMGGVLIVVETGTVPDGVYTIVEAVQSCSESFDSLNLPVGYAINYTDNEFQLVKGDCTGNIDLNDAYLASDPHLQDFHALQVLTAQGTVIDGEDLQFKADSLVELIPEFEIELGASLLISIEDCPE